MAGGDGRSLSGAVAAGVACMAVVGVLGMVRSRRRRASRRGSVPQATRDAAQVATPGSMLFAGLRVVDMSTHVAGPGVARALGDMGAEVIKVEGPAGDNFRKTLVAFQKPRTFGTMFGCINVSKFGLCLDLKTKEGRDKIHELLQGADVLVVNTRQRALQSLGLDYETLSKEFPKLVYAQCTAWGSKGPDATKAGYDIGAFWASTGLAALLRKPMLYSSYPVAMGDQTTAQMLLTGIQAALFNRSRSGHGSFVSASLNHVGTWIAGPHIIKAERIPNHVVPDYEILASSAKNRLVDTLYKTKEEGKTVTISYVGPKSAEQAAEHELCCAFNVTPSEPHNVIAAIQECTVDQVRTALSGSVLLRAQVNTKSLTNMIVEAGEKTVASGYEPSKGTTERAPKGYDVGGAREVTSICRLPVEFSGFPSHGVQRNCPELGEHTEDIKERGWLSAHMSFPEPTKEKVTGSALQGVQIVELSDVKDQHDYGVSAAAKLLYGMGATVHKVTDGPDSLAEHDPKAYAHFNAGKVQVTDITDLEELLKKAAIVITDMSADKLQGLGISLEDTQKGGQFSFSLVHLVPKMDGSSSELSPMYDGYSNAPFGATLDIYGDRFPAELPEFIFDSIMAVYLASAACGALFHLERTKESQYVKVSHDRVGTWYAQFNWTSIDRDPNGEVLSSNNEHGKLSPLPMYESYHSKDGMWIQFLGIDTGRHLPKYMSVMPWMKVKLYARLLKTVLFKVLPNRKASLIQRLTPVFTCLGDSVQAECEKYTYRELQEKFDRGDVWYAPVRVPGQVLTYRQAWDNSVFAELDTGVEITCPIQIKAEA